MKNIDVKCLTGNEAIDSTVGFVLFGEKFKLHYHDELLRKYM